jgi:urea carboxylase
MGMATRYSFGGDDHIFVEVDEEMSLEAFFKSLSMTNAVRESRIKGVTEICPANASYQIRFDPDLISPNDMLAELKRLESAAGPDRNRPRIRRPHQWLHRRPGFHPGAFGRAVVRLDGRLRRWAAVHVSNGRAGEADRGPKILTAEDRHAKLTVGHGGCFGCIYSVRGAGGYLDPNASASRVAVSLAFCAARSPPVVE